MCDTCGCNREEAFDVHTAAADGHTGHFHVHRNEDGHVHIHSHEHELAHRHETAPGPGATKHRTLDINRRVMDANDRDAEQNRGYFRAKGVRVINFLSSPGSGKTALLERTLQDLKERCRMAVIVGDLATENDAQRLRGHGAEVAQINTGTLCHLDASMVMAAAETLDLDHVDLLFIENVGNLVCPASFDLGENERVVLLAVTEGEDKPLKYPPVFKSADAILVTKTDLAMATDFDRSRALNILSEVAPQALLCELSARKGDGMDSWYAFLSGDKDTARSRAVTERSESTY